MKRILVTGGSRGLGLEICVSLLSSGYSVVTISRNDSPALQQALSDFPGQLTSVRGDLSRADQLARLASDLQLAKGFDGFVGNAAIGTEGLLTLTAREKIEHCIQLNLTSVILLTREIIKGMLKRGGSLVFISSIAAREGYSGLSVYSATKGALVSFSRSLAREYGPRNIRSNCILPGFLETEMTGTLGFEDKQRIQRRTPLDRLGQPSDVIGAVKFLLSDESRFITGTELVVDGGLTA